MCGIAGIVNFERRVPDRRVLEDMVNIERHRGPDDQGLFFGEGVGLGHCRLSIIDLSREASQPMSSEDGSLVIIHNGEIYNYLELRKELEPRHAFKSKSDTEVILHAYEEWGPECLKRFNGMWAFAIWDRPKNLLFASRDRFGVKPFYYYRDADTFVFASEIKAVLKHPSVKRAPNEGSIFSYLASGYGYMDISDETFFEGIKQLKPSHYFRLWLDGGRLEEKRYWDLDPSREERLDEKGYLEKFHGLLKDSVTLRLRSDVPVGISLSGGLDSSAVACVASEVLGQNGAIKTFSSCFEEEGFDERRYVNSVLEKIGAEPNFIFSKAEDLFGAMDDILWHQEEPYSTLSIFPQWYVMKLAREKGVKVLLTGQAGDETLAGYHKYYFYYFADLARSLRWCLLAREADCYKRFNASGGVFANTARIVGSYMLPRPVKELYKAVSNQAAPAYLNEDFASSHRKRVFTEKRFPGILNNDLYNALKISPLPSLLHIDDRSSMAHSVESRSPFLDYRLVEFLFSVPAGYKIRDGFTKYILRESLKGVLPEDVRTRHDKMGFATPLEEWFRTSLRARVEEILNSKEFASRCYFNIDGVRREFGEYLNGKKAGEYTIWSWINLELWLRKFID